jgi:amino acid adenylation domain-containing protein
MTAGAAYVPLDAASPPGRIRSVLDEARPRVVIADPSLARVLGPVEGAELVSIPPWPGASEEAPEVDVDPRSAAYVIYTSGSTGAPKGVVVEHRSLLNLVSWHLRAYELGEDDRCSQIASAGFDAAVWELWPALAAGASVHVCDDETRSDVDLLPGWLEANGITVAFVPTPLAEVLLGRPWPAGSPLRVMLTGGDRLRLFADPSHPYRLVNHYGPTEGTVVSTAGRVEAEPFHGRLPRIGAPIRNTVCYVVGPDGELLGPGCSGELWIGGIGVARGYHGDPGLGGRFLPNPFADSPDRVYRTGDLVRWEEDGSLSFLDRVDNQLKIRGHRIEPREVEAVLLEHTRVAQAFVTGRAEGEDDSTVLVAYAVPSEGEALDGRALRRWLRGRLPEPMIPSWVVVLRELPITANGKIDRDALPPPSGAEPESPVAVGPANPTEEALCRLWADALGVERVGVDEDFFDLGGHSLLATQLVSRIREAFRFELPLRTLFEQPTVAQIAAVLRSEAGPPERADRAGEVLLHVLALPEEAVEAMLAAQSGIET